MSVHGKTHHAPLLLAAAVAVLGAGAAASRVALAAPRQAVPPDARRAAHMQMHFGEVMTVHEAVIRGDLAAVREPATRLAGHEAAASLPAGSAPFVAEMRRTARRTAAAGTIQDAALGAAEMLKTCGDCHRALGTMPSPALAARPDVGGVVGHMLAHQQAVDQLLQGLVVPSSASWRAGADALRGAPLRATTLPPDRKLTSAVIASEKRLHELAAQAGRTEEPAARAVFYGEVIARCAGCHALHERVWGPARR